MITQARVLAALATVHDPELDEPITDLGFVGSCVVSGGGDVDVHLRLPTPQCAPNFAFLMASDAREAVLRVPGVGEVGVVLDDHYTRREINDAVSGGGGFGAAFPGESTRRPRGAARAVPAQGAARPPGPRGRDAAGAGRLRAAAAEPRHAAARRARLRHAGRALRADLPPDHPRSRAASCCAASSACPTGRAIPALIAGDGSPLPAEELPLWLRRARLVGLSLESNGGICRSLLRVRHGVPDPTEEVAT